MAKLLAAERQNKIVELLEKNGGYKMVELAEILDVSKETIRRDLNYLNSIGAVEKSHGGAIAPYELRTRAMASRVDEDLGVKEAICRKALDLIPDQGVIFLDTGSTVTCLARLLSKKSGLTIITNSLSAANELVGSANTVILTGGQINSTNMSLEGFQATNFLGSVKFELAVFGTNGFEGHNGPTTCDFMDVQTKKTALDNAKATMVITESGKASVTSLTQYASWRDIDHLVTDTGLPEKVHESLSELTDVILAEDE
ncbi:MAG: DeoR/GlpR family DNA-binding transcription regulator [Eubacteriaceae bacterium]|jgi:DeoR family fructose operon transcriptional repressor